MIIVVQTKKETDNIIGLKEDVAMRLEDITDIKTIGVYAESEITLRRRSQKTEEKKGN